MAATTGTKLLGIFFSIFSADMEDFRPNSGGDSPSMGVTSEREEASLAVELGDQEGRSIATVLRWQRSF